MGGQLEYCIISVIKNDREYRNRRLIPARAKSWSLASFQNGASSQTQNLWVYEKAGPPCKKILKHRCNVYSVILPLPLLRDLGPFPRQMCLPWGKRSIQTLWWWSEAVPEMTGTGHTSTLTVPPQSTEAGARECLGPERVSQWDRLIIFLVSEYRTGMAMLGSWHCPHAGSLACGGRTRRGRKAKRSS